MKPRLREMEYPEYSAPDKISPFEASVLESRIEACRRIMEARGLTHLVVYGDREHFANLHYLTDFDPRFEEALLIISDGVPLLMVGNEGEGHLPVSALVREKKLRTCRFPVFSLMNQPREMEMNLEDIFRSEGIAAGAQVGVVGWKYYDNDGFSDHACISDVPAYIWMLLCSCAGQGNVVNATDILISPEHGLRAGISAEEIVRFEYSNIMGSECVKSILSNIREGDTDFEIMKRAGFTGYPFACHPSIKSSGNLHYGLSSPTGDPLLKGKPCSISISYWGSNICRAGWIAAGEKDLPADARDYVDNFAGPYFFALKEWLANLQIGRRGGDIYNMMAELLPFDKFHVSLNPGHLIHNDEWLSSPIFRGSEMVLRSGMYIQSDIIPRSPVYSSARMEEGFVLADAELRRSLEIMYPAVYDRCMQRRSFMEKLGFELPDELLPLSDLAGIMMPFFMDKNKIFSLI